MVTPRSDFVVIVGGKSRLLEAGCLAQARGLIGIAIRYSEATETINPAFAGRV